jgi:hypothetical protein
MSIIVFIDIQVHNFKENSVIKLKESTNEAVLFFHTLQ